MAAGLSLVVVRLNIFSVKGGLHGLAAEVVLLRNQQGDH